MRLLRRQARVRVRGRDQDDALVTQDRVGDAERGARARGPDHGDDVRVGRERGRTGLPAFRRAPVVLLLEGHVVPEELTRRRVERVVQVVDRERDAVVAVRPQERGVPGDREQRRQLDRIAGGDLHAPELVGCTVDRPARGGRAAAASGRPPLSSLLQAAATSVSAPRSASIARYLRFFIQPPSEGVLRSWSYANAYEERRFAPFLPFRRGGTYHIPQVAGHPAPSRRVPEDVRNREHARTARGGAIRPVPPIGTRGRAPGRTPCRRRATDGRARSPPPRRRRTSTPRRRARARRSPPPPGAGAT